MPRINRISTLLSTLALTACLGLAAISATSCSKSQPPTAAPVAPPPAPGTGVASVPAAATGPGAQIAADKCAKCHGTDMRGIKGFSPSIRASGALKEYSRQQFETTMKTGVDNEGKPLKKPMPTFGFDAAKADTIYAYLKSLP